MRGGIQLTVGLVLLELLVPATTLRCDRTPEGHVTPKLAADNRFQLKISGSPDKYVAGEGYTITLHGVRNHGQVAQKFTGFMLVVEPQSHLPLRILNTRDVTPRPVGTFTLYGDTLTKFSPNCPNMVTHTSSMPKTEVQVRWTAPPPGSGCVIFRATVIEYRDVWYQDDGPLSKMLCEEVQESDDTQPDIVENCCACDEAKYEVTFEGLWSRHTHPKDFPSNSWLTRFSDVIGASHSMYYRFWEYGGFASEGLRQVAEKGSTRALESELKSQSQNIRTIIKARGISYPNVTGKTFAVFRVDKLHHLMSLVSMIDPSPDWVVGVSSLELCLTNCSWVESKVLNLYPWDVGTDSGVTYISPDQQSYPRDKIRRITTSFPNDARSPFYDQTGAEMKPLARLYLTRQRLYEKSCHEEPTVTDECALSEWSAWTECSLTCGTGIKHRQRHHLVRKSSHKCPRVRLSERKECIVNHCRFTAQSTPEPDDPHCEVGEWGDWSRCLPRPNDHTCKHGAQQRYRRVKERGNSRQKYCLKYPSSEERSCIPSMSPAICPKHPRNRGKAVYKDPQSSTCCEEEESKDYGEEDVVKEDDVDPNEEEEENERENNETTDNEYPNGEGGEGEGEGEGEDYGMAEEPSGECAMTQWSEWSPCSVTCGAGLSRRFRQLLNPPIEEPRVQAQLASAPATDDDYGTYDEEPAEGDGEGEQSEYAEGPCSLYRIQEVMGCNGTYPTCQFSPEDAREICALAPHAGRCPGPSVTRWYYSPSKEDCSEFQWSGCRGNKNRFLTWEECKNACQAYTAEEEEEENVTTEGEPTDEEKEDLEVLEQRREQAEGLVEGTERPVRNCKFSRWSKWSECDAPCNQQGVKIRTRYIEVHAKNGGKDCIGKTRRQKECFRKCKANGEGGDDYDEEDDEDKEKRHKHGCRYSKWSEWTECTATCGLSAMRQRTRQIVAGNPFVCADRIRKRACNVGPCPGSLL